MVELLFLPSVSTECPDCHGTRYQSSTLEIAWRGRNIAEILAMSVEEAAAFLTEAAVAKTLRGLVDVGLGYVTLGRPLSTRSDATPSPGSP